MWGARGLRRGAGLRGSPLILRDWDIGSADYADYADLGGAWFAEGCGIAGEWLHDLRTDKESADVCWFA
jgi:hypothetical protein